MNKQQVITQLKSILEATKVSDFSGAFADTAEACIEDSARETLELTISLFELSGVRFAALDTPKPTEEKS